MKKLFLVLAACCVFISPSCRKNRAGGTSLIQGKVVHHAKLIPYASVFIKFKAKEFPGTDTTKYDLKVKANETAFYTFKCYKGDYYLYSVGIDSTVGAPYRVRGGSPVKVRNNETVNTDLAVTE